MIMCKKAIAIAAAILILVVLDACTVREQTDSSVQEAQTLDNEPSSSEFPPPGTMRTVSIEPVQLAKANLIKGGDFTGLWAGHGSPPGFGGPDKTKGFSSLGVILLGPKVFQVRQTWNKGMDGGDNVFRLFHTVVKQLRPETRYRFSCSAKNLSEGLFRVSAWQVTSMDSPGQKFDRLSWELVCITPSEDFKEYTGEFTTLPGEGFAVILCASARDDVTSFPATVIWGYWRLVEARP
jgi:hypothetical protein